jgi:hypothetical protein
LDEIGGGKKALTRTGKSSGETPGWQRICLGVSTKFLTSFPPAKAESVSATSSIPVDVAETANLEVQMAQQRKTQF